MRYDTDNDDFVKDEVQEQSSWEPVDFVLTIAGKHVRAFEPVENSLFRGGTREGHPGRKGFDSITPEQQEENEKKRQKRNNRELQDLIAENEKWWVSFDTGTYGTHQTNPDVFLDDFDTFKKFVTRKVQERFDANFVFLYVLIYGFQDGKRRKDAKARYVLHWHMVSNLPFWKTYVITTNIKNPDTGKFEEHYLQNDGTWNLIASRDTLYFDAGNTQEEDQTARRQAVQFLKNYKKTHSTKGLKRLSFKALPFYTIAWGKGHVWRDWFNEKREKHQIADFASYMAGNYMDTDEDRLHLTEEEQARFKGKKGFLHAEYRTTKDGIEKRPGGLERPAKLYNEEAKQWLTDHNAWDCLTGCKSFVVGPEKPTLDKYRLGLCRSYRFNLWAQEYEFIKTLSLDDPEVYSLGPDYDGWGYETALDEERERRKQLVEWENMQKITPELDRLAKAPIQEEMPWFLPSPEYSMLFAT